MWNNLVWALIGALIGNVSADPTSKLVKHLSEVVCSGERLLAEGKVLRKQAIHLRSAIKHAEANVRLAEAASCGNLEASAQLGMAHCHGWGVSKDPRRGWQMIRTSFQRGALLSPDWFSDPNVCPSNS